MRTEQPADHEHERLLRERRAYQYTRALERGDWETVAAVLALAADDRLLDEMIAEINAVYAQEAEQAALTAPAACLNHHHSDLTAKGVNPMIAIATPRQPVTLRLPYTLLAVAAALTLFVGIFTALNRGGSAYLGPGGDNDQVGLLQPDATPDLREPNADRRCFISLEAATEIALATEAGGTPETRLALPAGFGFTRERAQVMLDGAVWSLVIVQAPGMQLYGWTDDPALVGDCVTPVAALLPTVPAPLMTATSVGMDGHAVPPTATSLPAPDSEVSAGETPAECIRTLPAGTVLEVFSEPGLTLSLPLTLMDTTPVLFGTTREGTAELTWVHTTVRTATTSATGWVNVDTLPITLEVADACETDVVLRQGSVDGASVLLVTLVEPTILPPITVTATPMP